jgi:hypothetical protein
LGCPTDDKAIISFEWVDIKVENTFAQQLDVRLERVYNWQQTQWEEFVELCEEKGKAAKEILEQAKANLDDCPFCVHRNPLRNDYTEGHCWCCDEFLLSEEDLV